MKKTKIHEVISIQTINDLPKLHERIGYYLSIGKKIDVKIKHGKAVIIEQKVKRHAKGSWKKQGY